MELDPIMMHNLLEIDSLGRIHHQQLADEVTDFFAEGIWEVILTFLDETVCFLLICRFKRRFSTKKFVTENSDRPVINSFVVGIRGNHLGRKVVESATKCLSKQALQ